jgi:hypothetical protein
MEGRLAIGARERHGWQRQVTQPSTSKTAREKERSRKVPLSTVIINTGARRYGLPANAKERRM